jgi:RNA polymerase sigma-70 factor, ECF subfamily
VSERPAHRAVEAIWRIEGPRVIAAVARVAGDVGLAEDFAQDALLEALRRWPADGVPARPGAWLTAVARRRAIDHLRADRRHMERSDLVGRELAEQREASLPEPDAAVEEVFGDDLLRLIFTCCHPVLPPAARAALTLRLVGGLTAEEIARAYLVPVPTLQQRIVRAKRQLAEARVPYEIPGRDEIGPRLDAVLEVVYLIFNEGYTATAGERWTRPELCDEALRLGRILGHLAPGEPEVHGLVALMELQASRLAARTAADGTPIVLADQDRGRWDRLQIGRGLAALDRAFGTGAPVGPYTVQAAIAACHARAPAPDETDWPRIVALYEVLERIAPSPVVSLNRAVAVGMADGPGAALPLVEALEADRSMARYHLLPAVHADLLGRAGRPREAAAAWRRAAGLTRNERERALMLERAAEAGRAAASGYRASLPSN